MSTMPHLDSTFFASQLFWLSVFFIMTYFFLKNAFLPHVKTVLVAREKQVKKDISAAEKALDSFEKLQKEMENTLSLARESASNLRLEAVKQAKNHSIEQMAKLEEELGSKFAVYEEELLRTREKIVFELHEQYDTLETEIMKVLHLSMQYPSSVANVLKN